MNVLMRLLTIEKNVMDKNMMFIPVSILPWQSNISWIMKDFVNLSELLIYTHILNIVDDVGIIRIKSHDEKLRYQRQFYTWTPML